MNYARYYFLLFVAVCIGVGAYEVGVSVTKTTVRDVTEFDGEETINYQVKDSVTVTEHDWERAMAWAIFSFGAMLNVAQALDWLRRRREADWVPSEQP